MSTPENLRTIAHHDPDHGPRRMVLGMVLVTALFVIVALIWATVAQLDVAVQAPGAVEAPSRIQEIQSLEGGIVEQLRVSVGQKVQKGELLVRLDTAQYSSSVGESQQQNLAALAGRARTDALLSGTAPKFDPVWQREAPALIEKETQLWRDSLRDFQATAAAATEVTRQRSGQLQEARTRIQSLQSEIKLGEESFAIEERLFKQGAGSRADYLTAQQKLLAQRSELTALQESLPRLQAGLAEAKATEAQGASRARAQWGTQRTEFETKVGSLSQTLQGQGDKLARRELFSPVDGVVNRVLVNTKGGVAQPGKAILEIVPNESPLLMTVRVKPSDIGFLHPDQEARVRVLPYDASTFGQMTAKVTRVGADAVVDEKGNAYFEVQLIAERGQLKLHGKALPVSSGMPVEVSILTGERSVMQYLLKPVLRGVQSALQER
jgi:adhesin transport system membrane fusion protein